MKLSVDALIVVECCTFALIAIAAAVLRYI